LHDVLNLLGRAEERGGADADSGIAALQFADSRVFGYGAPIGTGFVLGSCKFPEAIAEQAWNEDAERFQFGNAPLDGEIPARFLIAFATGGNGAAELGADEGVESACGNEYGEKHDERAGANGFCDGTRQVGFGCHEIEQHEDGEVDAENRPDIESLHDDHSDGKAGEDAFDPELPDVRSYQDAERDEHHPG